MIKIYMHERVKLDKGHLPSVKKIGTHYSPLLPSINREHPSLTSLSHYQQMDSSKILEDMEECSSNESGWTMYIASPAHELDYDDFVDEEYCSSGEQIYQQRAGRRVEDIDSDDSMTSDASSGPSYQGQSYGIVRGIHGFSNAWNKRDNKQVGQKNHKQEEKKRFEQIKAAKEKFENKKASLKKLKNK